VAFTRAQERLEIHYDVEHPSVFLYESGIIEPPVKPSRKPPAAPRSLLEEEARHLAAHDAQAACSHRFVYAELAAPATLIGDDQVVMLRVVAGWLARCSRPTACSRLAASLWRTSM
jgi:hypothetical protein